MPHYLQRLLSGSIAYGSAKKVHNFFARKKFVFLVNRFHATGQLPLPREVLLEVTWRCNLKCRMCYQERRFPALGDELSSADIVRFFDHNPQLEKVTLIGGEPFVRTDMPELIKHLDKTRALVISTNATLLGKTELKVLKECRNLLAICISLDGPAALHDTIRGAQGTYQKTVKAIAALTPQIPVMVSCVILNENLELMSEVIAICRNLRVKRLKFSLERRFSQADIEQTIKQNAIKPDEIQTPPQEQVRTYPPDRLAKMIAEAKRLGRCSGIEISFEPAFLENHLKICYQDSLRAAHNWACRSLTMATITPDGSVVNCHLLRKSFGNIITTNFRKIWNSPETAGFRKQLLSGNLTRLCENCPYLVKCRPF